MDIVDKLKNWMSFATHGQRALIGEAIKEIENLRNKEKDNATHTHEHNSVTRNDVVSTGRAHVVSMPDC